MRIVAKRYGEIIVKNLYTKFKTNEYVRKTWNFLRKFSLLGLLLLSFGIYFLIETISRHSIFECISYMIEKPAVYAYNVLILFTTYTIVYITKHRRFTTLLITMLWLAGGIANGVVLAFRVTPFTGTDLTLVVNALTLVNAYLSIEQLLLIGIGLVCAIIVLVYAWVKLPKRLDPIKYKRNIVLIALAFGGIMALTKINVEIRILSTYFGNIAFAYQDYGFPYCFLNSVFATGIDCPNDYSEELVKQIVEDSYEETDENVNKPNIIFLQLESFFNPELVKSLTFSEEPIPNFKALQEEFSTGFLTVPSVGAGTANTEFEIMTGMSLRYFGPGEYPYKTVLKTQTCESVMYDLKKLGYSTHAIHNNEADFYDRKTVFANIGYDTFTSEEMMNVKEYTPMGWAKDECLIEQITDALESTQGSDYIYTISVQGHGGYPAEPILANQEIEVFGCSSEEEKNSFEYYVNQIHEMDEFIADLIEELSKIDEDIVLVMYGDHLPTLNLEAGRLVNHSLFQTEYVIWDNMGLNKVDKSIKSYQLSAMVLDRLGIHEGTLVSFHQNQKDSLTYQADLNAIQYDMLYGEKYIYDGEIPYEACDLKMGVKEIKLENLIKTSYMSYTLTGENFTKASVVYLNDKEVETTFVNSSMLRIEGSIIKTGDTVKVYQMNDTYGILAESNEIEMTN